MPSDKILYGTVLSVVHIAIQKLSDRTYVEARYPAIYQRHIIEKYRAIANMNLSDLELEDLV